MAENWRMWRGHIKLILFFALPISALILISVPYAPNYLNYADPPTKADAVVLFIENTHIEVLEAKRIMDHSGFKKANFVSSPSHMRRIKMITNHTGK